MTFDEYQKQAQMTVLSSGDELKDIMHWVLGITGESGEIAEKVKKIIRDKDGVFTKDDKTEIAMDQVAVLNLNKLKSRKDRGVLGGSGDNR
jgi:predicted DNA-binding ArsR family transcriptional regulator